MSTQKELGTKAFQEKDYHKAIECFTLAIQENAYDHTLYSNRSASYYNLGDHTHALSDAEKCIHIKSDWGRGYQRKAMALHSMNKYDEAIAAYEQALTHDPSNAQIKQGLEKCRQDQEGA
jgi:stress-induced-phosphoprotein 1